MTKLFYLFLFLKLCLVGSSQNVTEVIQENYSAWVLNTDFNLPAIRFNTFEQSKAGERQSLGRLSVFNSVGAGISVNRGFFTEIKSADHKEHVINTQMKNRFGLHMGMLFSYPNDSTKNFVFAPTLGLQILDIQFGMGYELGTIQVGENRLFYTLAYRIPIKKLYNLSYIRMKRNQ
ncbi:MAG: hypothetical protein AAF487_04335 [Bacteroidota bacterium]